jgi:hypothetical protein
MSSSSLMLAVVVVLFTMAMAWHVLVSLSLPAHDITGQSHSVDYIIIYPPPRALCVAVFFLLLLPFCCCCTFQTDTNNYLTHPTLSSSLLPHSIFNFFHSITKPSSSSIIVITDWCCLFFGHFIIITSNPKHFPLPYVRTTVYNNIPHSNNYSSLPKSRHFELSSMTMNNDNDNDNNNNEHLNNAAAAPVAAEAAAPAAAEAAVSPVRRLDERTIEITLNNGNNNVNNNNNNNNNNVNPIVDWSNWDDLVRLGVFDPLPVENFDTDSDDDIDDDDNDDDDDDDEEEEEDDGAPGLFPPHGPRVRSYPYPQPPGPFRPPEFGQLPPPPQQQEQEEERRPYFYARPFIFDEDEDNDDNNNGGDFHIGFNDVPELLDRQGRVVHFWSNPQGGEILDSHVGVSVTW